MFDEIAFDEELSELIRQGRQREAEEKLLEAHAKFSAANEQDSLVVITNRLAQFFLMPSSEDQTKAEYYFLECERLSSAAFARLQSATFYFYVQKDFNKTIKKVDEIKVLRDVRSSASYYSALTLKGQACINLGMTDEAAQVLQELLHMIKDSPPRYPFGDEVNFLEAAAKHDNLVSLSRQILALVIPKIRSQEYAERAKALLESL